MICIQETLGQLLPEAGAAERQQEEATARKPHLAWAECGGLALGLPGVLSGVAEAWRNPGKGWNLVPGAQAGLGEASWMTPFSLFETQAQGSS